MRSESEHKAATGNQQSGDHRSWTRRQYLGSTLAATSLVGWNSSVRASESPTADADAVESSVPMAQSFVVVDETPIGKLFCDDPALTRLSNGELLASWTPSPERSKSSP